MTQLSDNPNKNNYKEESFQSITQQESQSKEQVVLGKRQLMSILKDVQIELSQADGEETKSLRQKIHKLTELLNSLSQSNGKSRKKIQAIAKKIRQASDLDTAVATAVNEVKNVLGANRVLVYQLTESTMGKVIAESMENGFTPTLGTTLPLVAFGGGKAAEYHSQGFLTIGNRARTPYQQQLLEKFQIQSSLALPILVNSDSIENNTYALDKVWGLLVIQQCDRSRQWQEGEINLLSQISIELTLVLQQKQSSLKLGQQKDIFTSVNQQMQQVMQNLLEQMRQSLKADRVLVYGYNPDWSGEILAESVDSNWQRAGNSFDRDYFLTPENCKRFYVVNDIYTQGFARCLVEALEKLQVRAYIVVPIEYNNQLLGLLAAYQNSGPRNWQESEVNMMLSEAAKFSFPLQQTTFVRHSQFQTKQMEKRFERERGLTKMLERMRLAKNEQTVFQIATQDGRKLLEVDRFAVYRFNPDWSGEFIAESVAAGWSKLLESVPIVQDTFLQETQGGRYKHGECFAVDDIYLVGHKACHVELLEQFEARAYAIAPIFVADKKLWGFVAIYQNSGSRKWQTDEVDALRQIGLQVGIAMQQISYIEQLQAKAEQEKARSRIVERINQSLEIDDIFTTVTQEVRQALKADRSVVYQFNPDWSGQVIAESVAMGWMPLLIEQTKDEILTGNRTQSDRCLLRKWSAGDIIEPDTFLQQTRGGRYVRGQKFTAVDDIYTKDFPACYIESLEKYQARAYIISPIFQGDKLWGLLGVYQNSGPRTWQESEAQLMMQIATQLPGVLQQAQLLQQIQTRNEELTKRAEREAASVEFSARLVSRLAEVAQENTDPNTILEFATNQLRQVLKADRVGVYRFDSDWMGEFIVESVGSNWPKLVGTELAKVQDTYLKETKGGRYVRKESLQVNNIYEAGHDPCHIQLLEKWGTKAYMISPIFQGDRLWGLLGVYQNDRPREWEVSEQAIVEQVATQIGVTLQLSKYLSKLRSQEKQLTEVVEREKTERENLQRGALRVLRALQPSFQGDLTVRAPLSEDEIGTIADGYNTTIDSLRDLVRQVQVAAARVSETSSVNTDSVNKLSNQAGQQVDRLEEALQKLQLMLASAQTVTTDAQKVEEAVQEANYTVQAGDSLMERTVDGISEIRETVSETAKKIKRLGEASQKISKVVNLIENFATQTNLLSLNAAIEATRAGEYGKGFAVVADEVRSLAYQSANATTEIERLVNEIQAGTKEVTEAMEVGIAQVVQGTELVNETRLSLNAIVTSTTQISELVQGITQTASVQTQQSQALTEAMNEVSAIANQTSENANSISDSFLDLLGTSQELQASVSKFKVD